MKKTIQINIGGILFHLDDDAYEMLQNYLHSLRKKFNDSEEGKEIIQDIETRIAELFSSKVNNFKQVITLADVEEVINILGQPEDFTDEENTNQQNETKSKTHFYKDHRRLHRDTDNALLGGICAGIAAYFRIDPVFIRIVFIVLLFLSAFSMSIVYIVLWFIIPPANTTAQKLEMRGEKVTIENIEKTIKQEYEKVQENFKRFRRSKEFYRTKEVAYNATNAIGEMFRFIFRFIGGIIGFALMVAGIVLIVSLAGLVIFKTTIFTGYLGMDIFPLRDSLALFIQPDNIQLFKIGLILVIFVPLVSIIAGGIRLMLGVKGRNRPLAIVGFILWFLGAIVIVSIGFIESQDLTNEGTTQKTFVIEYDTTKPLVVNLDETMFYNLNRDGLLYDRDNTFVLQLNTKEKLFIKPDLDIHESEGDKLQLIMKCDARGKNREDARLHSKKINYNFSIKENVLTLPPYYTLQKDEQYKFQELDIDLMVPKGTKIIVSHQIEMILDELDCPYSFSRWDIFDNVCEMTDDGLTIDK
ncbi:MAG: PspC domain-containing protein [Bacteroidales bacterium]|nr:PspC domain-containing protein [Bacteroidales bacterium]